MIKPVLKFLVSICLALCFHSCYIGGSFKGLYSYSKRTRSEIPEKFLSHDEIDFDCDVKIYDNKIVITRGDKLKECFNDKPILLYNWSPQCSSKICYPLTVIQDRAKELNRKLIIVAEYYDAEMMSYEWDIEVPIYAIDVSYYGSNKTTVYASKFYKDLGLDYNDNGKYYFIEPDGNYHTERDLF